ncbi:MAG: sigma-54-dependent Fis family transcriptional regulator [Thermoplasmata archaeon]|nr:sigma-54-dependent Fis family transcriptional regulator [Thermoplasmata archaeon]
MSGLIVNAPEIIGQSPAIRMLLAFIQRAALTTSNVLIVGDTGVGKELAARTIHFVSKRKNKPFLKINCAELNENLIESELFGNKRGAFTDACSDRPGLIESAEGGTFLFDEFCDISPRLQAKLLSVIEDKELRRLGENHFRKVDTRFIFAMNKNPQALAIKGEFRQDLLYRISVLNIYIPPLRDRPTDIPLMIDSFIKRECLNDMAELKITQKAIELICSHPFPGNVRELENVLIRACDLCSNRTIQKNDISFDIIPGMNKRHLNHTRKRNDIIDVLRECDGNKSKAAKELGISRMHLYRLLKESE